MNNIKRKADSMEKDVNKLKVLKGTRYQQLEKELTPSTNLTKPDLIMQLP